jgi:uncharacterized delta-60 repeat protein
MRSAINQTNNTASGRIGEASRSRRALALLAAMMLVSSSFLLQVQAAEGDLDPTFGIGGKIKTGFLDFGFDGASAVAIQSDGKIVAAGFANDSDYQPILAMVRYETNGNLDSTFGTGGRVAINSYNYTSLRVDLAIQSDGKIVVVGPADILGVSADFGLFRFDTNGNPDPTFGVAGKVTTDFFGYADEANSVAIQSDGKIVVTGVARGVGLDSPDFALARYESNGDLDGTFGVGGKVTTDFFGKPDEARGVVIQNDGKIIAAGFASTNQRDFGVARYDANGALDGTFGTGGKVTTDFSFVFDEANAVALQSDGRIVVAGIAGYYFGIVRYDTSGNPDGTFGVGGKVTTDFFGVFGYATDVAIQSDGRIIAAGTVGPDSADVELSRDFGIARYNTDGSLDATFGTGGKVTTDFQFTDEAQGVAIQSDCKIVVAGYSWDVESGDSDFALARYDGAGCLIGGAACPRSHGHWKNDTNPWPVNSLTLGSQSYTQAELLALLGASTQTDASLILARQLIAAKLNVANGSDPAPVAVTIAHADSILSGFGGKLPYKVKSSSVSGQAMTVDAAVLTSYNNGQLTPGCAP